MKKTPLYDIHKALGAKIIPFAGYEMPVRYTGDKVEHLAVRNQAGIFDVSHMGEFFVSGSSALDLLQRISSNDVSKLVIGKAQYGCLTNYQGGIVDDFITYRLGEEEYMLVVNASNIEKDWSWIETNNTVSATLTNESDNWCLLAVSGPQAATILQPLISEDISHIKPYYCWRGKLGDVEEAIIATTGYTGEQTFELFVPASQAVSTWKTILDQGADSGLIPTGLGARDTLRLEMGYMLYGNDINDETTPLEAGLGWITKLKKGTFNGSDVLAKQKEVGVNRKLIGFKMLERGIPRSGYAIASEGEKVGVVTSGSMSPVLNQGIGLGYVPAALAQPNQPIQIVIRDKMLAAEVVKPPFFSKN